MAKFERMFPLLVYADIAAAQEYLVRVLQFDPGELYRDTEGNVVHGEVRAGDTTIWLHRVTPEHELGPANRNSACSGLVVHVDDVDAHFRHAQAAGAEIESEPVDQPYGQREYGVKDLEGHRWWFATQLEAT